MDYIIDENSVSWVITDAKDRVIEDGPLNVELENDGVRVAVNENTAYGATYKVTFKLNENGKETTLTVKTLAQNKSVAKVSLSAKGKLETGYLEKEIIITPKWSNLTEHVDLTDHFKVYAKETTKGAIAVDVTDKFTITANENGTYSLKIKDVESLSLLKLKAKYSVCVEDIEVNEVAIDNSKAISITMTVSKASIKQSAKTVKLYLNDRYSNGLVKLTLNNKGMSKISKVELVESNISKFYDLKYWGNGEYVICYKNNQIASGIKAGTIKLKVYLEGNTVPNATVNVSVKNVKFGK